MLKEFALNVYYAAKILNNFIKRIYEHNIHLCQFPKCPDLVLNSKDSERVPFEFCQNTDTGKLVWITYVKSNEEAHAEVNKN